MNRAPHGIFATEEGGERHVWPATQKRVRANATTSPTPAGAAVAVQREGPVGFEGPKALERCC
jgi:hypothetical protein